MHHDFDFDLLVIGAGSGGVSCARRAAGYGARVAIVERERREIGGTCVLHGCVPKKLLVTAAQFGASLQDAAGYGWQLPKGLNHAGAHLTGLHHGNPNDGDPHYIGLRHDWAALQQAKNHELRRLNGIYENLLINSGVTILEGTARLVDAHTVAVNERTFTAKNILIATGSHPQALPVPGNEHAITSDVALDLPALPRRMVIIGAGYIGVEFAGIFHALGTDVHLVYRRPWVLPHFDHDCARHLSESLAAQGIILHPESAATAIADHGTHRTVTLNTGQTLTADVVLNATGRRPNVADLNLDAVGIVQRPDTGAIVIDAHLRTSVPHIYAVGDVVDDYNLTPYAIKQGRALADALLLGKPVHIHREAIPTAVFSQPPLATVGLSEQAALSAFASVDVHTSTFRPLLHTLGGRQERTFMKLVVDPATDRVLGVHMVGLDAPEIMQGFATALLCGATKAQFDATVGIHPSSAEEFVTMTSKRTVHAGAHPA
jgi:glutathione reductase (NADPH)